MLVFGSFVGGTPGRASKWWCWCGACLKDRPQKHIGFPNVQKGQGCSTALVFHNRFNLQRLDVKYVLGACVPKRSKGSRMLYSPCVSRPFPSPTSWSQICPGSLSSPTFKRVKDALQPLCFSTFSISNISITMSGASGKTNRQTAKLPAIFPVWILYMNLRFGARFWELRRGDPRASLQMMMTRGLLKGPASEAHRLSKRSKGSRMLYSPCVSQPFPSPTSWCQICAGGFCSQTFKRVKDALQPLCFSTVSISHILKSNMSWGPVSPNVQKGQGCSTALVFLNLFHLQHLHNNVWGIRENKPPNSKTSGDLPCLNPLYEFAFWCSFLGAS